MLEHVETNRGGEDMELFNEAFDDTILSYEEFYP